jgi:hypothetical protein
MPDPADFLREWHQAVSRRDSDALAGLLAPEVRLASPPYGAPFEGHALVHHLLGLILETIEEFTYHRQWRDGRELALEFTGRVGELRLQGIDLITLDHAGRIRKLDVMIRPADAVEALRDVVAPRMTEYLKRQESA